VPAACLPSQPSPGSIEPGSFSLAEVPPQSSFASSPATQLSPSRPPTEVSALIAVSPSASTPAGDSIHLLRSVPRLSQPLDGLLRVSASQVCFAPQATSRVHARPGVSRSTQPSPVSRFRAPMPLAASRSRPRRNAATSGCLDFEALIRVKSRAFDLVLPAPNVAPLIGLSSSGCLRLEPSAPVTRRHPLMTFVSSPPSVARSRRRLVYSVLSGPSSSSIRLRFDETRSRFRPCSEQALISVLPRVLTSNQC
jgi:hypothetical protein